MSLIRGVLLAGKFRTRNELNQMSEGDQRNALIVDMTKHSNQSVTHYQSLNDFDLAGVGAVMVFLRETQIRDVPTLKTMSDGDQRNAMIVELNNELPFLDIPRLQGMSNMRLVLWELGSGEDFGIALEHGTYIRGVLLAGKFRTRNELNQMSEGDQRNALIVDMTKHSNQSVTHYQSLNDFDLAGVGAVMVFLRETQIRDDPTLKTMSDGDQRNAMIVEMDKETSLGISRLQGLRNMDLVRLGLGVDPVVVFKPLPPPLQPLPPLPYVFSMDSVEIRRQKADNDHSDSDWLSITVTVGNPITKNIQTLPAKLHHIGGRIKTGDIIAGPFVTDSFIATDSDVVVVTYLLTNLGSSDAEEQFAQAVKVTDKVVEIVGPIVGTAIGLFFGAPGEGFKIGQEVAKGFDAAISALSDVFDFLGIHVGPPNCNGEVLHDTLTFQPGELVQAVNHPASREYTGPQEEDRCGGAPESKVNFSVQRIPFTG